MTEPERRDAPLTVIQTQPGAGRQEPPRAEGRTPAFERLSIGQAPEPAHKRLVSTLDMARELKTLARDLGIALAGANPSEPTAPTRRSGEKGFFAGLDAQAGEIERELESARVALENIRRLI